MGKATHVHFVESRGTSKLFRVYTPERDSFSVDAFENGIATIDPGLGTRIKSLANIFEGCFKKESNFENELLQAFECEEFGEFKGIRFEFNGVTLLVTKENADADKIYAEWETGFDAVVEKEQLEREAYIKTLEFRAERAKYLKHAVRREVVKKDVLAVSDSTELQFKDEEAEKKWEKWLKLNSKDSYSLDTTIFACRWGKYMQHLMEKHNKTVADVVDGAFLAVVSTIEGGVTGFMSNVACASLMRCWKYGNELEGWRG